MRKVINTITFEQGKDLYTKETVYNFYILENHNFKSCQSKFKMSQANFKKLLDWYGIKKDQATIKAGYTSNRFMHTVDVDSFKTNYLNKNLSLVELSKMYNVTTKAIRDMAKRLGIYDIGPRGKFLLSGDAAIKFFDENKQEIIDHLNNYGINKTAQKFNFNLDAFKKILAENKIVVNSVQIGIGHGRATKLEKYGSCAYNNREKSKKTNLLRYGGSSPTHSDAVKKKIKQTVKNKYGVDYPLQSEFFQQKRRETLKRKYGTENYSNTEKREQTCLKKYGYKNASSSPAVKNKVMATIKEKYGYSSASEMLLDKQNYTDLFKKLYNDKEQSIQYLKDNHKNAYELAAIFNCSIYTVYLWSERLNLSQYIKSINSHYEDEIIKFIKELGIHNIQKRNRSLLNGLEIDIYLPDYKIGIEFNGNYWHSSLHKPKYYHFEKAKIAEENNIRLIQIWEYEWIDPIQQNKIKSLLKIALGKVDSRIYARKCEIREISNAEAKEFNNRNHLQGHRNAQITYGLFYNNELVQLMSFSKNKKYEWEIIRGCPASNNIVVGGVSKLFNHFIKLNKPNEVFSYCDFNKFDGHGYTELGLNFIGYTGPDKKWLCNHKVVNRNPKKYKELKKDSIAELWGAGSKKYLWKLNCI